MATNTSEDVMEDALLTLLCRKGSWSSQMSLAFYLEFEKDGTGQVCIGHVYEGYHSSVTALLTRAQLVGHGDLGTSFVIAMHTKWKLISRSNESFEEGFNSEHTNKYTKKPELLAELQLEITTENRMPEWYIEHYGQAWNDRTLTEAAFKTRTFSVIIEKGNFMHEHEVGRSHGWVRYGLRMRFNVSPYPELEGFNYRRSRGPDLKEWAEILSNEKTFYAEDLPKSSLEVRATNDDSVEGHTSTATAKS